MENRNIILLKHLPSTYFKLGCKQYREQVDDNYDDYVVIDVTSNVTKNKDFMKEHPTFVNDFSPMRMGPIKCDDGSVATTLELLYQCSKVYPCFVDSNGDPTPEYFEWRNAMFSKTDCSIDEMRHPNKQLGFEHKDTLYFLHYDKEKKQYIKLNQLEADKLFFVKTYAKYVVNTESYRWLKSLIDSGKKVALVDFDIVNYYSENAKAKRYKSYKDKCKRQKITPVASLNEFLNIKTIKDVYNFPYISTGHAGVLKMLLEGDIEVINGEVVDNIGVLDV